MSHTIVLSDMFWYGGLLRWPHRRITEVYATDEYNISSFRYIQNTYKEDWSIVGLYISILLIILQH